MCFIFMFSQSWWQLFPQSQVSKSSRLDIKSIIIQCWVISCCAILMARTLILTAWWMRAEPGRALPYFCCFLLCWRALQSQTQASRLPHTPIPSPPVSTVTLTGHSASKWLTTGPGVKMLYRHAITGTAGARSTLPGQTRCPSPVHTLLCQINACPLVLAGPLSPSTQRWCTGIPAVF